MVWTGKGDYSDYGYQNIPSSKAPVSTSFQILSIKCKAETRRRVAPNIGSFPSTNPVTREVSQP